MDRLTILLMVCSILRPVTAVAASGRAQAEVPAPSTSASPPGPLLVMPFVNEKREPRAYWLQEAAAVLLADQLNALGAQAITRTERVRAFERLQLPADGVFTQATVVRVGQLVGAKEVIIGRVELSGNELTVKARTLRLDTGRLRPEALERAPINELFPLFERVARKLVPGLRPERSDDASRQPALLAFENYIKGLLAEAPDTQLKFLQAAIQLDPAYDRSYLAMWQVHTEKGDHERALAAASKVAPSSRQSRRARFLAGLSELELKRYDQAFTTFQQLQEEQPLPSVANNLGVVQIRRGWTPGTGRPTYYFNQAHERDPADPDYFFNLGYAYWLEKDVQAAIYWLREAVRRDPANGDAHFVLGTALQATGAGIEAVREKELARQLSSRYDEWQRRPPGGEQVPNGLERVRIDLLTPQSHRIDDAITANVQREHEEVAAFHLDRGRRLLQEERDQEALSELRRSVFLSPYQAEAHLLLGRLHLRAGRLKNAIDALKIAVWIEESAAAHAVLGEAYLQSDEQSLARAAAERALILDPTNQAARALLQKLDTPGRSRAPGTPPRP